MRRRRICRRERLLPLGERTGAAGSLIHVALSLVGILSGLVVVAGMWKSTLLTGWTLLFLATPVATSVTGFGFHREHLLPSHIVGIISLVLLAVAILALYVFALRRAWRWIYVVTAVASLYLNVFVLIAQAFLKVPALHALAPTQNEPPFAIAQGIALVAFIAIGVSAARKFRPH
jgi:hypothetical protein